MNWPNHWGGGHLCPQTDRKSWVAPLHECLAELDSKQKLLIHLRFWEEMDVSQIAIVMNLPWTAANGLLEQTLLELRGKLIKRLRLNATAA